MNPIAVKNPEEELTVSITRVIIGHFLFNSNVNLFLIDFSLLLTSYK